MSKDEICKIVESHYKGTYIPQGGIDLTGDYLTLRVLDMKLRNMPYCAKRLLDKYPKLRVVHFTGGWQEHVYTRSTLAWMGYKKKGKTYLGGKKWSELSEHDKGVVADLEV